MDWFKSVFWGLKWLIWKRFVSKIGRFKWRFRPESQYVNHFRTYASKRKRIKFNLEKSYILVTNSCTLWQIGFWNGPYHMGQGHSEVLGVNWSIQTTEIKLDDLRESGRLMPMDVPEIKDIKWSFWFKISSNVSNKGDFS